MVRITQVPESPRSLSISVDLNFPLNGVPHWMTETLANSALMKEAFKCSKTLPNIDQAMVRITQVSESPRSLSISVDLNFPLNGVPHWMTETLAGSALMKEASKCSETLQEYRSGHYKSLGKVSGSDLKCNPSKRTRSGSQKCPPSLQFAPLLKK
jgi:hypothetical protein